MIFYYVLLHCQIYIKVKATEETATVMKQIRTVLGMPKHLTDVYITLEDLMSRSCLNSEDEDDSQDTYDQMILFAVYILEYYLSYSYCFYCFSYHQFYYF